MIASSDYEFLCAFLLKRSGLYLGPNKEYLLEARLIPVAQTWGLAGLEQLVLDLRRNNNERLNSAVTEAMTTNETLFFRDKTPFDELRDLLLPPIIESRKSSSRLRIWCAAASTGQEPYSLAMLLLESFPQLQSWKIDIVGTDLCSKALARAEDGVYSQFEVQRGLPIQYLMKNFEQVPTGWKIKSDLKKHIQYRSLNLLDNFAHLGQFDLIMCRNVLIYFENDIKKRILDRMAGMLRPDGYLILGAAETVMGITDKFDRNRDCKAAVYRPLAAVHV